MKIRSFENRESHIGREVLGDQGGSAFGELNPLRLMVSLVSFSGDAFILGVDHFVKSVPVTQKQKDVEEIIQVIDAIGKDGETAEAERQRLIEKANPLFNEVIEERVLAVQPYFYGRRLDGKDMAENAYCHLNDDDFADSLIYAHRASKLFAYGTATAIGLIASAMCMMAVLGANLEMLDLSKAKDASIIADTFSAAATETTLQAKRIISYFGAAFFAAVAFTSSYLLVPAIASRSKPIFARAHISNYLSGLVKSLGMDLPTKDFHVAFNNKMGELNGYLYVLRKRIAESRRYKSMKLPTISFGTSTGEFRNSGVQNGLERGTPVEVAVADLYMNLCMLGGTGSGKTSALISPAIRQLFIHRKNGTIGQFGMYVTDAKGVLWVDIKEIAIQEGLSEGDVIVIGTDVGQYGVHLTKGVSPQMLPALINSIMSTVEGNAKGGGGSAFYEGMFAIVSTHMAVLLDAYDRSAVGSRFTAREFRSIYCIERLYEMLTVENSMELMIIELLEQVKKDGLNASYYSKAAQDAVEYFRVQWRDIEKETKANLRATVQKNLGGLMSHPGIKTRFFEGRDNILMREPGTGKIMRDAQGNPRYLDVFDAEGNQLRYVDVDGAYKGKLVCISVSAEQGGMGASFALSALAARFKMISTDREIAYKTYNDKLATLKSSAKAAVESVQRALSISKKGFGAKANLFAKMRNENFEEGPVIPDASTMVELMNKAPSNDSYEILGEDSPTMNPQATPTFFIADEFQELVIKGGKNFPVGDEAYWAKNRSKGVIGMVAFQFLSSIKQFIGQESTTTMIGNMRNKIALHTEDKEMIQLLEDIAGSSRRYYAPVNSGYFESQQQLELQRFMMMEEDLESKKYGSFPSEIDAGYAKEKFAKNAGGIGIVDGSSIFIPRQKDTLSHKQFEAVRKSILDDQEFSLRASEAAVNPMSGPQNKPVAKEIALSLHDKYISLEEKARDGQMDKDEVLVSKERVMRSRNHATAYFQSYSGTLIDYFEVKQNHEWQAERRHIHEEIAKQRNNEEAA
ncbi:type IV secretion system DNA-binding domain-containing protein [Pseudomonas sp. R-28-1W-6]|uniref:TraM recognition domain-containing protein n=1 Tax=Pseudomonas sp. R-28-1W-6 TaxID=2650101 RepID=UPI0013667644|nr:type IV secretion system DNA-binding domain-containing protein [Pseudomonas sp. R-28-1W-6]MWV14160.1 type IV secretion system DNA-binding domain-containing protein [Pseudomonas sp. R-28-1W-6]